MLIIKRSCFIKSPVRRWILRSARLPTAQAPDRPHPAPGIPLRRSRRHRHEPQPPPSSGIPAQTPLPRRRRNNSARRMRQFPHPRGQVGREPQRFRLRGDRHPDRQEDHPGGRRRGRHHHDARPAGSLSRQAPQHHLQAPVHRLGRLPQEHQHDDVGGHRPRHRPVRVRHEQPGQGPAPARRRRVQHGIRLAGQVSRPRPDHLHRRWPHHRHRRPVRRARRAVLRGRLLQQGQGEEARHHRSPCFHRRIGGDVRQGQGGR